MAWLWVPQPDVTGPKKPCPPIQGPHGVSLSGTGCPSELLGPLASLPASQGTPSPSHLLVHHVLGATLCAHPANG